MFTNIMHGSAKTIVISSDIDDFDLADHLDTGGLEILLRVNSGVIVSSSSTGPFFPEGIAISCSDPALMPSRVMLVNKGSIWASNGYGGVGTTTLNQGGYGGTAITLDCPITIYTDSGTIQAGGGGGGAALHDGGGGYPGGYGTINPGTTARYGFAAGGGAAGDCLGAGLAGENGTVAGGAKGYAINASGNTVSIVTGAVNITGDII